MAFIEITRPSQGAGDEVLDFLWVTIDADPDTGGAALEWEGERGFCFRLRRDVAQELIDVIAQDLSR